MTPGRLAPILGALVRAVTPILVLVLLACGRTDVGAPPPRKPLLSLDPPGHLFAGSVAVTLRSDVPATVRWTTDGSDPGGPAVATGTSPQRVVLSRTTLLRALAVSGEGVESDAASAFYERGGPEAGTIAGVIHVGVDAAGVAVGVAWATGTRSGTLVVDPDAQVGQIPFLIEGLSDGRWTVRAVADTSTDGRLQPLGGADLVSEPESTDLILSDPRRAGAEGMVLYLGRSRPGLSAVYGKITVPRPQDGRPLSMMMLDASGFSIGGGTSNVDPAALLGQLLAPLWTTQTRSGQTEYWYKIYDVAPGTYLLVPALGSLLGPSLSFIVDLNLFGGGGPANVPPDSEIRRDFAYGPWTVSGNAVKQSGTLIPAGMVAMKPAGFTLDFEISVAPALLFFPTAGGVSGPYRVEALREEPFAARLFTFDGGTDAITGALSWLVNPFDTTGAQLVNVAGDMVTDVIAP